MFKYGLYEVFKDFYSNLAGKENAEKYKGLIWCAGSASAEVFADVALCPLEMVLKILTKLYIDCIDQSQSSNFPSRYFPNCLFPRFISNECTKDRNWVPLQVFL